MSKKKIRVKLTPFQAEIILAALAPYHQGGYNAEYTEKLRPKLQAHVDKHLGIGKPLRRVIRKPSTPIVRPPKTEPEES